MDIGQALITLSCKTSVDDVTSCLPGDVEKECNSNAHRKILHPQEMEAKWKMLQIAKYLLHTPPTGLEVPFYETIFQHFILANCSIFILLLFPVVATIFVCICFVDWRFLLLYSVIAVLFFLFWILHHIFTYQARYRIEKKKRSPKETRQQFSYC